MVVRSRDEKGQSNRRGEKENEMKNKTYNIFSTKKKRNKELESLHRNSLINCRTRIPHSVANARHGKQGNGEHTCIQDVLCKRGYVVTRVRQMLHLPLHQFSVT